MRRIQHRCTGLEQLVIFNSVLKTRFSKFPKSISHLKFVSVIMNKMETDWEWEVKEHLPLLMILEIHKTRSLKRPRRILFSS